MAIDANQQIAAAQYGWLAIGGGPPDDFVTHSRMVFVGRAPLRWGRRCYLRSRVSSPHAGARQKMRLRRAHVHPTLRSPRVGTDFAAEGRFSHVRADHGTKRSSISTPLPNLRGVHHRRSGMVDVSNGLR